MSIKQHSCSGALATLAGGAALLLLLAASAYAQNGVLFTPDVSARLGTVSVAIVEDEDIALDDAFGSVTPVLATLQAALPANAELAAFDQNTAGELLIALDISVALPGLAATAPAEPQDVLRFQGATATFDRIFDGSANGVPQTARIDALGVAANGALLLSFDTSVSLPGVAAADDEDLVSFASGSFTLVYDGSASGIDPSLDLDAVNRNAATGRLLLSFDGSGSVGGVFFDDEDVLAFTPGAGSYAMYFDGSQSDPIGWPPTDLVAIPEPSTRAILCAGGLVLALLARARARNTT